MEEIWKDIPGYEGLYQVSNQGRVKSLARICVHLFGNFWKEEQMMSLVPYGKGANKYRQVRLRKDGISKLMAVHRLVAEAFIPNPNNYPVINHIDENPSNNCVDNLEWCTQKHNCNHGTMPMRLSHAASREVLQYTLEGELIAEYPSAKIASQKVGVISTSITSACRGRLCTAGGFLWRYKNSTEKELQSIQKAIERRDKHKIVQLTLDGKFVALYDSLKEAADAMNCHPTNILFSAIGRNQTSHGYCWMRYLEYKKSV